MKVRLTRRFASTVAGTTLALAGGIVLAPASLASPPRTFQVVPSTLTPASGAALTVHVTALNSNGVTTDSSYTGTPVLTSTDGHFTPGSCEAAVAGVASCSAVSFGDLGAETVTASGTGGDSDREGSKAVTAGAQSLAFTTAPTTAPRGSNVSYTVVPTAANSGAIAGYAGTRTLHTTGSSNPADGTVISCAAASCTFQVKWTTGGQKSISVSDESVSTPTVAVTVPLPTSLSSALDTVVVKQGSASMLSGTLLDSQNNTPISAARINIYRHVAPSNTYTYVTHVTTDGSGTYHYTATGLHRNTALLPRYVGSPTYSPVTGGGKLVYVRAGVTVTFPASVTAGKSFTVTGTTSPLDPGADVVLQEVTSTNTVITLASSTVRSNGRFSIARPQGLAKGGDRLRVLVGPTPLNWSVYSASAVVKAL